MVLFSYEWYQVDFAQLCLYHPRFVCMQERCALSSVVVEREGEGVGARWRREKGGGGVFGLSN